MSTSILSKLNLSPQEQRIVVVVVTVVLVVLNALFVWPRFKEWGTLRGALDQSRETLRKYQSEIVRTPQYEAELRRLERQGSAVLRAAQALDLMRTVQGQAQQTGVTITDTRPAGTGGSSTNQFFDEQLVSVGVTAGEKEMIDFLVALGSGDSMIRVRDMDLKPDPPQYRLLGKIALVASYQKNPKTPPASPPSRTAAPAVRPSTNTTSTVSKSS
ncbi:MAG TPA: hypothetical protein PKM73_18260 [Verrucomicrobiota bacterium]|nr:hypothetical protein [Verrucomicrobiota bacterium]HNU52614.1 hypothetical protein [Verrucomicrobiota bacterium]